MTTHVDFCGLPVTASATDVAAWDAAAQDFLAYHGPAALTELVRTVPDLALARALHAVLAATGGAPGVDPAAELSAAEAALDGVSERERAFVATVRAESSRGPGEPTPWLAYLHAYPGDLLGRFAVLLDVLFAFRPDRVEAVDALLAEGLRVSGRHPFLAAAEAMTAQERADLDRAQKLADAVLAAHPDYVAATHVLTHVHYERGHHASGLSWLEGWVQRDMRDGCEYAPHLSWHAALHELALDDRQAVLRRLAEMVGPGASPAWLLSNGASFLWRLKLGGVVAMDDDPTDDAFRARTRAVGTAPPMLFAGWNAVLGLGCLGDVATLAAVERGDVESRAPGVREVLPALAGAVRALLEDRPAAAADALLAQRADWYRVGGSRAQREVLEDTLLAALVRAGRTEQAAAVLTERLDRRPSAGDSARLAALAVPLR